MLSLSLPAYHNKLICCRRLELAQTLTQGFVSVSELHHVASWSINVADNTLPQPAISSTGADLHGMPLRVRTHYVGLLRDWCVSSLTKAKGKRPTGTDSKRFVHDLYSKWQLVFVLLSSVDTPAHTALNTNLVAAAATACKSCSTEQAVLLGNNKLASALQQSVLLLNTKFKHSFRPSLEHRSAASSLTDCLHTPSATHK